jgi:riboflavin-specific deaminase-like protein
MNELRISVCELPIAEPHSELMKHARSSRPRVIVNMAMSLDGKVTSTSREPVAFTSQEDRQRLVALRAESDAILVGAGTLAIDRHQTLGVTDSRLRRMRRQRDQPEHPLRAIVSGRLNLPTALPLLRNPISPVIIACTRKAPVQRRQSFSKRARVIVCGSREVNLHQFISLLAADYGVRTIVCEGGPTLNDALFRAGLVDELFLTIIPRLVGGQDAPTLVDGLGFRRLKGASRGRLISCERGKQEWFLHYRF